MNLARGPPVKDVHLPERSRCVITGTLTARAAGPARGRRPPHARAARAARGGQRPYARTSARSVRPDPVRSGGPAGTGPLLATARTGRPSRVPAVISTRPPGSLQRIALSVRL